jgi:hypothetical protein
MSDELLNMNNDASFITPEIIRAMEGILMVAIEPVPGELLAQLFEVPVSIVEEMAAQLSAVY